MLSLFTKSLQSLSSVKATALSTTANILCSGAASAALFGEHLATRWLLGATCLIAGTAVLTSATRSPPPTTSAQKEE